MFSCKYWGNFKITCFEDHLRTAASIRCYFDTIDLKQSGFCTANSFKILVFERKYKNTLKNRDSQKKKKKSILIIVCIGVSAPPSKTPPPSFLPSLPPLNRQTVQAPPLLRQFPPPILVFRDAPLKVGFFSEP